MKECGRKENSCRLLRALLLILLCVAALQWPFHRVANAYEAVDVSRKGMLTVEALHDGVPLAGATFSLYRIGEIDESAELYLSDPFASSFTIENAQSRVGWDMLAQEMADYCQSNQIDPFDSKTTNHAGDVCFGEGGTLPTGLYLVVGESVAIQNVKYTMLPFLISLPLWNAESYSMDYTIQASPKVDKEIQVTPSPAPQPTPPPDTHLPQTGMLWWPIPVLLIVGLFLIGAGFLRRRGARHG